MAARADRCGPGPTGRSAARVARVTMPFGSAYWTPGAALSSAASCSAVASSTGASRRTVRRPKPIGSPVASVTSDVMAARSGRDSGSLRGRDAGVVGDDQFGDLLARSRGRRGARRSGGGGERGRCRGRGRLRPRRRARRVRPPAERPPRAAPWLGASIDLSGHVGIPSAGRARIVSTSRVTRRIGHSAALTGQALVTRRDSARCPRVGP